MGYYCCVRYRHVICRFMKSQVQQETFVRALVLNGTSHEKRLRHKHCQLNLGYETTVDGITFAVCLMENCHVAVLLKKVSNSTCFTTNYEASGGQT